MRAPTVLHLNLSEKSFEARTHEDLSPLIGGIGWALALLEEGLGGGRYSGPAGGESVEPVVFAIGPLSGVIPGCSKTVAAFRSPQSGFLTTSLGGGHLARFLRFAGYQALVIEGRSQEPVVVSINGEQVIFKDGSHLLNKEVPETFELLFSAGGVSGQRSIVAGGLAMGRDIVFAPLYVDEFFSFSRGGLGAVFAQRNLTGLVVSGEGSEGLDHSERYREVFGATLRKLGEFKELSLLGTLKNLKTEKKISGIPFENLADLNFEDQYQLNEAFSESSRLSCSGCPVGCIHLTRQGKRFVPYDYDGVAALGPLLGITSKDDLTRLLGRAYSVGLDPVSLGVVLAYLTEHEGLSFGNADTYLALIDALLSGREKWAKALSRGLAEGVKTLGGEEFALTLSGMEILPYFNGYATLLSQSLALSATTEDNRGVLLDLDFLRGSTDPAMVVSSLIDEEKRRILTELLVGCGYLSAVFEEPAFAFSALEALEMGVSHEDLDRAVEETFRRKLFLQKKTGFDPQHVKLPARLFSVPSPQGILEEGKLRAMVDLYLEKVGWADRA
jgi:aldehyde:ferredoxin oxidoreductase